VTASDAYAGSFDGESVSTEATKARMLAHRAHRAWAAAEAEEHRARREFERAWTRYVQEMLRAGVCAFCGLEVEECECVFTARGG
jgi:hypothetical protein